MADFIGKIVLVTGAAGNLGSAVARLFAKSGARLALLDHDDGRLAKVFPDMVGASNYLMLDSVDSGDPAAMKIAVDRVIRKFGRLDVLVNTVGGYQGGQPLHQTPLETWDRMMNLNARTVFIACQQVIPQMLEQGSGKIVNVAARAGLGGSTGLSAYSASKSAVIRLTESLAAEVKTAGVNVNCVLPGTIDTLQNRAASPGADTQLWVSPQAIAEAILFLASDAARGIHGASVPVYGPG